MYTDIVTPPSSRKGTNVILEGNEASSLGEIICAHPTAVKCRLEPLAQASSGPHPDDPDVSDFVYYISRKTEHLLNFLSLGIRLSCRNIILVQVLRPNRVCGNVCDQMQLLKLIIALQSPCFFNSLN